ncbi:hypothetical protein CALVIDRAFT_416688 [Calocera viscosa TUFC12733]|uniref:Uncharacterized protein n=1 Tax=Calocera viscosa (strain TUFC12733) TaxID=1330018 RepID=A0A167PF83_CALVF|nr:hypothetical protein CALVIDRAFT_416688 [Calocera viscosa TUFC12733]
MEYIPGECLDAVFPKLSVVQRRDDSGCPEGALRRPATPACRMDRETSAARASVWYMDPDFRSIVGWEVRHPKRNPGVSCSEPGSRMATLAADYGAEFGARNVKPSLEERMVGIIPSLSKNWESGVPHLGTQATPFPPTRPGLPSLLHSACADQPSWATAADGGEGDHCLLTAVVRGCNVPEG